MFVQGSVKTFVYTPGDGTGPYEGEVESWAENEDAAMQTGCLYFLIILSSMGIDHPHHKLLCDHGYGPPPERKTIDAPAAREPSKAFTNLTPPYVRVRCTDCGEEKDAWVADDGTLEDARDAFHWHDEENIFPTEPIEGD